MVWRIGRGIAAMKMKCVEFVKVPTRELHPARSFQEMNAQLFGESVDIVSICSVLQLGCQQGVLAPCVDLIGNLELINLLKNNNWNSKGYKCAARVSL